jgi:hypothetical protein
MSVKRNVTIPDGNAPIATSDTAAA